MRETKIFYINGKAIVLPIFVKGDRVSPKDNSTMAINPTGTVNHTKDDGFFVFVDWDKKNYKSKDGGTVQLGSSRMVDGLRLI